MTPRPHTTPPHGDRTEATPRHREVEDRFRRLLARERMEKPDRVVYEPAAVGFVWDELKLVVFVDFDDGGPGDPPAAALLHAPAPGGERGRPEAPDALDAAA